MKSEISYLIHLKSFTQVLKMLLYTTTILSVLLCSFKWLLCTYNILPPWFPTYSIYFSCFLLVDIWRFFYTHQANSGSKSIRNILLDSTENLLKSNKGNWKEYSGLLSICDGVFYQNSNGVRVVNYFCKKVNHRCLRGC